MTRTPTDSSRSAQEKERAAILAMIRDRSAAYYGSGSQALAAAIEAGEHETYGGAS